MGWLDDLRTEAGAIWDAPWSFTICVAIATGLVWAIFNWRYGETIAKLKERVEHRDDRIKALEDGAKASALSPDALIFIGGQPAPVPPPPESKPNLLSLDEAATWLYENSVQMKRYAKLPGTIGSAYPTLKMFCLAVLMHAGGKSICTIYARPEPGFGLERVEENQLEIASYMASLGAPPGPFRDGCVGPEQLERARDWIDSDPSNLRF